MELISFFDNPGAKNGRAQFFKIKYGFKFVYLLLSVLEFHKDVLMPTKL